MHRRTLFIILLLIVTYKHAVVTKDKEKQAMAPFESSNHVARSHIWISAHPNRTRAWRGERGGIRRSGTFADEGPRGVRTSIHFPNGRVIRLWSKSNWNMVPQPRSSYSSTYLLESIHLIPLPRPLGFQETVDEIVRLATYIGGEKQGEFDTTISKWRRYGKAPPRKSYCDFASCFFRDGVALRPDERHIANIGLRNYKELERWFIALSFTRLSDSSIARMESRRSKP